MRPAITVAEMRALERDTMDVLGVTSRELMATAGRGVARVVAEMATGGGPIAVVCGGGGNGGDGFVVAHALRSAGRDTTVYLVVDRATITGDAAGCLHAYEQAGGSMVVVAVDTELSRLVTGLTSAEIVVDAVFGIGLTRPVTGHLAAVVAAINAAPGRRVAVDIPSGLDADRGQIHGVAVRAEVTVAMAAPKIGTVIAPGLAWAGRVVVVDIGVPPAMLAVTARAAITEAADVRAQLPSVARLTHKGRRGHVLVVAGSPGKRGAGRLAAVAALRAGAGLVTLAGPAEPGGELSAPDPIMTATPADGAALAALAVGKACVVIGPGMLDGDDGRAWFDAVFSIDVPLVVDATALLHLGARRTSIASRSAPVIVTPHPGEAARLLGVTAAAIEADRPSAVRGLAAMTGAVVVLKGAATLIVDGAHATGSLVINPTGGPALATAGSGDVLAGAIGGLVAQGLSAFAAAWVGAYIHGAAGDAMAASFGDRGVIASDLPDAIAVAMRDLTR